MAHHPLHARFAIIGVVAAAGASAFVSSAAGQVVTSPDAPASIPAEPWMEDLMPDPNDPRVQAYAEQQRLRAAKEREIRRFRSTYFGTGSSTETRQIGLSLLRERYDEPALYPLLLEVFERDGVNVKSGLLDMFADARTDEADATLAWVAVHDDRSAVRDAAVTRLGARVGEAGEVSERIKHVVAGGLRQESSTPAIAAAGIAEMFKLYEMVPLMIAAQVGGNTGGARDGTGNLGWIVVGQQTAFVADLQPVVSDSAVGFDPTLGVVTEGVVLEVQDAVVITYRTEIFYSLTRLTSNALGRPTGSWGIDQPEWWAWYDREWKPWMEARAAESGAANVEAAKADG